MAATVLLVRHAVTAATGKTLGGRTAAPLDERGRAQAEAAAQRLAVLPVKAVYASPLPRTVETARAGAAPHRLEVVEDEGLLEIDFGRWTDRALAPLTRTKLWPVIQSRPSLVRFPDGETLRGAQARAVDALEAIAARHDRKVVVAVSHADVIKAVVAFYLGMPFDMYQRLVVAPASTTVLTVGGGARPALVRFNDTGPFDPAAFAPAPRRRAAASAERGRRRPAPARRPAT